MGSIANLQLDRHTSDLSKVLENLEKNVKGVQKILSSKAPTTVKIISDLFIKLIQPIPGIKAGLFLLNQKDQKKFDEILTSISSIENQIQQAENTLIKKGFSINDEIIVKNFIKKTKKLSFLTKLFQKILS